MGAIHLLGPAGAIQASILEKGITFCQNMSLLTTNIHSEFRHHLLANKNPPEAAAPVACACFDNYPFNRPTDNYPFDRVTGK